MVRIFSRTSVRLAGIHDSGDANVIQTDERRTWLVGRRLGALRARAAPRHVGGAPRSHPRTLAPRTLKRRLPPPKQRSLARPFRRGTLKRWPTSDDPDVIVAFTRE